MSFSINANKTWKHFSRNIYSEHVSRIFPVFHAGIIVPSVSFCFQDANYAYATRQGILTKIRAREHSSNLCEQFEQRPNFASNFKLNKTIRYPFKRISLHLHPALHPSTLRTSAYSFSLFTILGSSSAIAISDSILDLDVTLDGSKPSICFVYWSRHIYFTSWLDNIDEFRWSTAEIASITTMFWPCKLFFVKCRRTTCIIISGLKHGKLDIRLE